MPNVSRKAISMWEVCDKTGMKVSYGMAHIQSGTHIQSHCEEGHLCPDDKCLPLVWPEADGTNRSPSDSPCYHLHLLEDKTSLQDLFHVII